MDDDDESKKLFHSWRMEFEKNTTDVIDFKFLF
jgi:hypothetical protein